MEIKAQLTNYSDKQRQDFIVTYNHNQGYEIKEYTTGETKQEEIENPETGEMELVEYIITTNHIEAWGYTEEELEQQDKERIAKLFLTGADVERGIYQAKGMDFDDIIALVEQLSQTIINEETGEVIQQGVDIDVKALKIELKANHFYRGNPYVNAVGALLGFTPEQLDKFFEFNDYTYLLPPVEEPEVVEPPVVEDETIEEELTEEEIND